MNTPPSPKPCLHCCSLLCGPIRCRFSGVPQAIDRPWRVPDEMLEADAARIAVSRGLHLVIEQDGYAYIVPQLLPGMICITSADKQFRPSPARAA